MDSLNNIPNVGNWGDAASKLNDNFNKVKQAVTTVENVSKNNKGYFTSLSALNTAFPNPKTGLTAYVYDEASSTNYYIYHAVNGAWVATSIEAPSVGVDLAEYTKTGGSTKTTKDIDDIKANHGYTSLATAKTLKEVDDDLAQLESEKADHGYGSLERAKTLKQVEDDTSVKMTNLLQNSSFENGVIAPLYKIDGGGSVSTLSINTINPISGNYDARLEVTTPGAASNRPSLYLNGLQNEWVLNHVFYFGMSVKINSGIPIIQSATDGVGQHFLDLILKDGFNSWTVKCAGLTTALGLIYLDGRTIWDFNFDNLIAYDLTAIFGEGNEPTKEEMDLLISTLGIDYFEGEITIPAQKVMQWQQQAISQLAGDMSLLRDDAMVKLTNLITNGNFIDSTGWTLNGGASIQNGELVLQGSGQFTVMQAYDYIINHSYYFRAIHESASDAIVNVSLRDGSGSIVSVNLPADVGKDTRSFILTPISANPTFLQMSRFNFGTYGTIIMDDIMVIDLTETFGVGNEPTAVEMDSIIEMLGTDYFEGEITFPVQELMQLQLKLIAEKPVTPNDTTFIKDSPNLFKKEGIRLGYDLSQSDGEEIINDNTAITDFIEFEGVGALVGTSEVSIAAYYYDKNKAFLARFPKSIGSIHFGDVPLGSRYVRFSIAMVNVDVDIMVNRGSVLLPYEPYGVTFTKKVLGLSESVGGLDDFIINEGDIW